MHASRKSAYLAARETLILARVCKQQRTARAAGERSPAGDATIPPLRYTFLSDRVGAFLAAMRATPGHSSSRTAERERHRCQFIHNVDVLPKRVAPAGERRVCHPPHQRPRAVGLQLL